MSDGTRLASDDDDPYRLAPDVVPVAYRISLEPDLVEGTFAGTVEIDVEVGAARSELVLNALELAILRADVVLGDGSVLRAEVTDRRDEERVALALDRTVLGLVTLQLTFTGVLNDRLVGFYRSSWTDPAGVEHPIATTLLCTSDARRAFPCFDEPSFKAPFQVTVVVPPGLSAFSNASVAHEESLDAGRRTVAFHPTIKMSSYLVALVVGPFEQTTSVDVDGVALSVVCTPGNAHLCAFAREVGAFALRFFAEYFEIPYPGTKVDLVGVPDFAYGAMENFGCVTFRETALLVDEATASTEELQNVAMVVAHELAHMWFGDLVTMGWWEGIWLNEAFATFLQFLCIDAFRPAWRLWGRFHDQREAGLEVDALHSTRPIEFPVRSPAEAMAMLDAITYQKGAAVLRMLEQFLGADVYRDGIRRYLHDYAYANTVTNDLWAALEAASGQPVGAIMDTWILQGGHPVVRVEGAVCTQSPFRLGPSTSTSAIGTTWRVPVRARSLASGTNVARVFGEGPEDLGIELPLVVNTGWGFYRSRYDASSFTALSAQLGTLSELERAVLVSDTWALARAGDATVADLLTLARGLGTAAEPSAWQTVEASLQVLDRFVGDALRPQLAATARALGAPLLERFGWERADGEDERVSPVRSLAVRMLGTVGADDAVRSEAARRFDAGELGGELADAIVTVVAGLARPGDRDELLRRMDSASDPQTAKRYRLGVAAYADRDAGVATLRSCFELFRLQDVPLVVQQLMVNRIAGPAVWRAMTEQWDAILARVPPLLQFALTDGVATFVDEPAFADEVEAFHRSHELTVGQRRVEQHLERMRVGVAFASRSRRELPSVLG